MPQSPQTQPQQPSGTAAARAIATPFIAGEIAPALAAARTAALTGVALAVTVKALVKGFDELAEKRFRDDGVFALQELRRTYPDRKPSELAKLIAQEQRFEKEFRRKMRERLDRDLPEALALQDDDARVERLKAIFDREKQYTVMRSEAMFLRALGKAEAITLKAISPEGAYWKLSQFVKEHTLDCLAMGEKFWPWEALDEFQPPVHHGCQCHLIGLDDAVGDGLMTHDQIPDKRDALARAREAQKLAQELHEALEESVVRAYIDSLAIDGAENVVRLEEAAQHSGAMVALYPAKGVAAKLAQDGGEPRDDLHLTLAFLGKAADLKDTDRLRTAVEGFAATCPPIEGIVSGVGKFTAGPEPVTYASADCPNLPEPRARLVEVLRRAGFPADSSHGFTPHITLAYDDRDPAVRNHKLVFDKIALVLGGKKYEYPLEGAKVEEARATKARRGTDPVRGYLPGHVGSESFVGGYIGTPTIPPGMTAAEFRRRYPKGYAKGGQFAPKLGGNPGTRLLRALFPHPQSPLHQRGERRGRWTWVNGRYTRVPEADHWEKTVAGHRYVSPPGSTNVYRDDKLFDGLGMVSPERRVRAGMAKPAAPEKVSRAADKLRSGIRQDAVAAISGTSQAKPPIAEGDPPSKLLAMRDAGWGLVGASPGTDGMHLHFHGPNGQDLEVGFDGHEIGYVGWDPAPVPPPTGTALASPPTSWDEHRADAFAWANEVAQEHSADVHLQNITINPQLSDHAGWRSWNGDIELGRDTQPDIDRAGAARAAGRALTDDAKRGVWSAYWVTAHEAVVHPVNPIDPFLYDGAHKNLEEALTEELAHVEAVKRLQNQGQQDVLDWRAANPDAPAVRGVYGRERAALGSLLDRAGVRDDFDRRVLLEDLKYRTDPEDRFKVLADALHRNGEAGDDFQLMQHAEDVMASPAPVSGSVLGMFRSSPGLEQVGRMSYGKFADAKLSRSGETLRLKDGGLRRVEKLPLMTDDLRGLTDGSAVAAYPPGHRPTSGLFYADGSPKSFRYVDTPERARLVLKGLVGQGSPGTKGPPDLYEEGDTEQKLAEKLAREGSGWTTIKGVPVKRRFDGSYGVGHSGFDGRHLSGVAGEKSAAAIALKRSQEPSGWAPPAFAGQASPGVSGWWKKLTHTGQGHLSQGEQEMLDGLFDGLEKLAEKQEPLKGQAGSKKKSFVKPDPMVGRKIGGDVSAPEPSGAIPAYDKTELALGKTAGGSNGARFAFDGDGNRWLVKTYRGDKDRVATELLANAVYRTLGVRAAEAGTMRMPEKPPDFREVADTPIDEPPLPKRVYGKKGKKGKPGTPGREVSTGVIVAEPDGRIWVYEPKGHFGGYEHTFPKGRAESGLTGQQNALKELYEETGLHAHVTGMLGDYEGDTGVTRYYLATRTGGEPLPDDPTPHVKGSGKETAAVKLVTPDEAADMLNRERDKQVLQDALKAGLPKGDFPDDFPGPRHDTALVYPTLEGEIKQHFGPSEKVGEDYMVDALVGNWDFVGMTGDNILWDEEGNPIRLDQGGTFELRAQGGTKPFGPVPTEVWTMLSKGQGQRGVKVTEDQLREQATRIGKTLTPAKIDKLVDAAPFDDADMRERVRDNLKARVKWMREFAAGKVDLPRPLAGNEAHDALFEQQKDLKLFPEQEDALFAFFEGMDGPVTDVLHKKGEKTKPVRKTIDELDSLMRHAQTGEDDVTVWLPMDTENVDPAKLEGKTFQEPGFMVGWLTKPDGGAWKLTLPGESHAVYSGMFDDLPPGSPDVLVARDAKVKIGAVDRDENGNVIVSGVISTQKPWKKSSAPAGFSSQLFSGEKDRAREMKAKGMDNTSIAKALGPTVTTKMVDSFFASEKAGPKGSGRDLGHVTSQGGGKSFAALGIGQKFKTAGGAVWRKTKANEAVVVVPSESLKVGDRATFNNTSMVSAA